MLVSTTIGNGYVFDLTAISEFVCLSCRPIGHDCAYVRSDQKQTSMTENQEYILGVANHEEGKTLESFMQIHK
jgi:hypothetical protein